MSHMPATSSPSSSSSVPSVSLVNATGAIVVLCTPVYNSAAASFGKAQADSLAHATVVGLLMATTAVGATGLVQTDGVYTADTASWDVVTGSTGGLLFNQAYYASTTAGRITTTAPSTTGQFVTLVGYALSTTQMRLLVQPTIGI